MAIETFPFKHLTPDWGLQDQPTADIDEVTLGDGYVLRRPKGINYIRSTWNPSYSFLTEEEQTQLVNWIRPRLGYVPFKWEHPVSQQVYQVICTGLKHAATDVGIFPVSLTLEQDFNPV